MLDVVPGPNRSRTSVVLETLISPPAAGVRSTIPTTPTTPEVAGRGGSTSKRASTRTPGTTNAGISPSRCAVSKRVPSVRQKCFYTDSDPSETVDDSTPATLNGSIVLRFTPFAKAYMIFVVIRKEYFKSPFSGADRFLWVALLRLWPEWRKGGAQCIFLATPGMESKVSRFQYRVAACITGLVMGLAGLAGTDEQEQYAMLCLLLPAYLLTVCAIVKGGFVDPRTALPALFGSILLDGTNVLVVLWVPCAADGGRGEPVRRSCCFLGSWYVSTYPLRTGCPPFQVPSSS